MLKETSKLLRIDTQKDGAVINSCNSLLKTVKEVSDGCFSDCFEICVLGTNCKFNIL